MLVVLCLVITDFFFSYYGNHRVLPVPSHSFPTRRSSDLTAASACSRRATKPNTSKDSRSNQCASSTAHSTGPVRPTIASRPSRSEEHTSELPSLMRNSYAVFCWKKKTQHPPETVTTDEQNPHHHAINSYTIILTYK